MNGDVTLGDHRLCLGDCFDVLPTLAAGSVDLCICDLPYATIVANGKMRRCTENAWDTAIPLDLLWAQLLRIGKPDCVYLFTGTMRFAWAVISSQPRLFRYDLVWEKAAPSTPLVAHRRPLAYHENLLVFSRGKCPYNPQMRERTNGRKGKSYINGKGTQANSGAMRQAAVYSFSRPMYPKSIIKTDFVQRSQTLHPTQKPCQLLQWIILTYSNPGAIVLDPTAGVMSASCAAYRTGRCSVSIERDPDYYAKGVARMQRELRGENATSPLKPKRTPRKPPTAQGTLW